MNIGTDESVSVAERFCLENRLWVNQTAARAARKRSLEGYEEDIAQEVFQKARKLNDGAWLRTENKHGYIARVIINVANDLCHTDPWDPLTETILPSNPLEAMQAAILIEELYAKLSQKEKELFHLMFEEYTGQEIAERLAIKPVTARKRISRLRAKLSAIRQGDEEGSSATAIQVLA